MSTLSVPSRARRRAAAACLVAAPVIEICSVLLMPSISGKGAAQLAAVAAHRGTAIAAVALDCVALLLFAGAVAGLATLVAERFSRWANAGVALAAAGIADLLVMNGINAVTTEMAVPGADASQMAALIDRVQSSPAWPAILALSLLTSAGLVVLAVGLFRSRAIARPAALGIAAGGLLEAVGFASAVLPIAAVGFALVIPGFVAAARVLSAEAPVRRGGLVGATAATATALSVAVLVVGASAALAAGTQHFTEPPTYTITCDSGQVLTPLGGVFDVVLQQNTTPSGNMQVSGTVTPRDVEVQDQQGNVYRVVGATHFSTTVHSGTQEVTSVDHFELQPVDGGTAGSIRATVHISPNGNVTSVDEGSCELPPDDM